MRKSDGIHRELGLPLGRRCVGGILEAMQCPRPSNEGNREIRDSSGKSEATVSSSAFMPSREVRAVLGIAP